MKLTGEIPDYVCFGLYCLRCRVKIMPVVFFTLVMCAVNVHVLKNRLDGRISLLRWPCTRFFRLTESKFVVYDVIGRNMFLNLLVVGFYRVFCSIS